VPDTIANLVAASNWTGAIAFVAPKKIAGRLPLMSQEHRHFNTSVWLINHHFVWLPEAAKGGIDGSHRAGLAADLGEKGGRT
jgi:hypothetical protein